MTNAKYDGRPLPKEEEIDLMLAKAEKIKNEYFRLRIKAAIGLLKKFGKRRIENLRLKITDLEIKEGYLNVTFTLAKKHKIGFSQFLKLVKIHNPIALNKPMKELQKNYEDWREHSEQAIKKKPKRITKRVALDDKYGKLIVEYYEYMKATYPEAVYLFPSGKAVFGNYWVIPDEHLSGRHLLRLVESLDRKIWCHLFREMIGGDIAKRLGDTVQSVAKIKTTLNLENEATAWHYVDRYAIETMPKET